MNFITYGPFELPRRNGIIPSDSDTKAAFWEHEVKPVESYLPEAIGCYVFALRSGRGSLPWYVGKTEKSFRGECFHSSKLVYYNEVLSNRFGTPLLFLIPKFTLGGKFAKGNGSHPDIEFLETYLIGRALTRNNSLINKKKTKMFKELKFQGFFNSDRGRVQAPTVKLRQLLGES